MQATPSHSAPHSNRAQLVIEELEGARDSAIDNFRDIAGDAIFSDSEILEEATLVFLLQQLTTPEMLKALRAYIS